MSLPLPRIYGPTSPGASVTSLLYLYDATGVMVDPYTNVARSTGIFRAIEPWDLAPTISALNISGINVNTDQLETQVSSGVLFEASISGQLAAGIATHPLSATTTNNYTQSGSAGQTLLTGTIFAPNTARLQSYVQVIGSGGPLYVKLGTAPASAQSFSLILKAASSDFGADGGVWSDDGFWRGAVSVSGNTRMIAWEA